MAIISFKYLLYISNLTVLLCRWLMENSVEILMVILVKLNIVFTNQKNDKTSFYLIYYFPQNWYGTDPAYKTEILEKHRMFTLKITNISRTFHRSALQNNKDFCIFVEHFHCVKGVLMRSYSGQYLARMLENADQIAY